MMSHLTRLTALAFTLLALSSCQDNPTEPATETSPLPDAAALEVAANGWSTRANMPSDRYSPAVAVVTNAQGQTVLYAIGGTTTNTGAPLGKVQAYNAATNSWTNRASLPVALHNTNGAGVINGKIYLPGGQKYDGTTVPFLFMYDPATNQWTRKRDMPEQHLNGVTGVYQNKLYVLIADHLYRYDPATNRWTFLSQTPHYHFSGMGGFLGGRFYVTGGSSGSPSGALDVYDPATNSWDTGAPMPSERWNAAYATIGGKLYIAGGVEGPTTFQSRSVLRYDPGSNTWSLLAQLPGARHGLSGGRVVVSGKQRFEVVGGPRPGNNLQYIP